jgi:streptomycin 6-kinase
LSVTCPDLAVSGGLHSGQVLRGSREPWLTVDPLLLRGDIEYELARVLWTRIDEMADSAGIRRSTYLEGAGCLAPRLRAGLHQHRTNAAR